MKPLQVGVVGAGKISASHLEGIQQSGVARAVAICDIIPERAISRQTQYGIDRTFTDYRDLLAQEDIEAVVVALPNYLHHEVSIAALKAGKHVLCEKPMTFRVDWAEAMVQTAHAHGKVLQIGMGGRYTSDAVWLREQVQKGELGKVYFIRTNYIRRSGIPGWGGWFTRKEMAGGGSLIDIGVHRLDLAWYLLGCPKPVSAYGVTFSELGPHKMGLGGWGTPDWNGYCDVEDLCSALIRFETGAAIALEAAWAGHTNPATTLEMLGTKKGAQLVGGKVVVLAQENRQNKDETITLPTKAGRFNHAFAAQMHAFVQAIRGEAPCVAPGEHGMMVVKMMTAIYESAQTGAAVQIV